MNNLFKRFLVLVLFLLLSGSAALADSVSDSSVCLNCGREFSGTACPACFETSGVWICMDCGTRNLSDVCMKCGKEKAASLALQAEDPRLLTAFTAVSSLASSGDPAALLRLGRYYELGVCVEKSPDKAVSCIRASGEAGYAPAWIHLGNLY